MRGGRRHKMWGVIGVLDEEGQVVEIYQLDENERLKNQLKRQKRRHLSEWLKDVVDITNQPQNITPILPPSYQITPTVQPDQIGTETEVLSSALDVLESSDSKTNTNESNNPMYFSREQLSKIDWLLNTPPGE